MVKNNNQFSYFRYNTTNNPSVTPLGHPGRAGVGISVGSVGSVGTRNSGVLLGGAGVSIGIPGSRPAINGGQLFPIGSLGSRNTNTNSNTSTLTIGSLGSPRGIRTGQAGGQNGSGSDGVSIVRNPNGTTTTTTNTSGKGDNGLFKYKWSQTKTSTKKTDPEAKYQEFKKEKLIVPQPNYFQGPPAEAEFEYEVKTRKQINVRDIFSPAGFETPESTPIDTIFLNGIPCPGYAEVINLKLQTRLQKIIAPGQSEATFVFRGYEPAEFTVKIHLYNSNIYKDFQQSEFKKLLEKRKGLKNSPIYRIEHPFLNDPMYGISSGIIRTIKGIERGEESGEWILELDFYSGMPMKQQQVIKLDVPETPAPKSTVEKHIEAEGDKATNNKNKLDALRKGKPKPGS